MGAASSSTSPGLGALGARMERGTSSQEKPRVLPGEDARSPVFLSWERRNKEKRDEGGRAGRRTIQ